MIKKVAGFEVECGNEKELAGLVEEIFKQECYRVELARPKPVIFDVGAHIGLASLYFKSLYPEARITAIEPVEENFKLLERNVWRNGLSGVNLIQAAVARNEGEMEIYVDSRDGWWSVAGVEKGAWNRTQNSRKESVRTVRLGSMIEGEVDLMKMDIEGMETGVLEELGGKLSLVENLLVEFHPIGGREPIKLEKLLRRAGFSLGWRKEGAWVDEYPGGLAVLVGKRLG